MDKERLDEVTEIEPVAPEPVFLNEEEQEFYAEHAAELNYLMLAIFETSLFSDDSMGYAVGIFGKYVFRLGREYEREHPLVPLRGRD